MLASLSGAVWSEAAGLTSRSAQEEIILQWLEIVGSRHLVVWRGIEREDSGVLLSR